MLFTPYQDICITQFLQIEYIFKNKSSEVKTFLSKQTQETKYKMQYLFQQKKS